MLPDSIRDPVRSVVNPYLRERTQDLGIQIRNTVQNFSSRGALTSGMFIQAVKQLCAQEVDARTSYLWHRLREGIVNSRLEVYPGFVEDVEAELRSYKDDILSDILDRLASEEKRSGFTAKGDPSIDGAWEHSVTKSVGEAKMEHLRASNAQRPVTPMTVTFHGPGIMQYGNDNSATQNISSSDVRSVEAILQQLDATLPTAEIDPSSKLELESVSHDLKHEIKKNKPNPMSLVQAATSIAILAEKLPALKPVYTVAAEFLKQRGVPLP